MSAGASLRIERVSKWFGALRAVDGVSLDILGGEFMSLVGPSGSGKTTLLTLIAGFDEPGEGRILSGSRDITYVPPHRREIGMVFQRYALFPHLTVAQNIAFPLRMRGVPRAEREERTRRALDMVRLPQHGDRHPAQLSGGQQQRVALARAIVFHPQIILMDEPLGALDKKLRQEMQLEIKELQRRLGATVVFVTHDQEEALTMSDRVAVLSNGRLEQLGTPRALYDDPASIFVADFLGDMNFLHGTAASAADGVRAVRIGAAVLGAREAGPATPPGTPVRVAVRPERLQVGPPGTGDAALRGQVRRQIFNGASVTTVLDLDDGTRLQAVADARAPLGAFAAGAEVGIGWAPCDARIFAEPAA